MCIRDRFAQGRTVVDLTVTPFEFGLKVANIATTAAIGFKSVKDILKTTPSNARGGTNPASGAGGGAQIPPAFNVVGQSDTNQLADAIGGQTQQPVQAFVVSGDVTTAQQLQNNNINKSLCGPWILYIRPSLILRLCCCLALRPQSALKPIRCRLHARPNCSQEAPAASLCDNAPQNDNRIMHCSGFSECLPAIIE